MINTPPTAANNNNTARQQQQQRTTNLQALHQQHQSSLRTTSGFTNAPFSKSILGLVVLLNFMKAILGRDRLDFSSPKLSIIRSIVQYGFTGHFVFSTNIELLLGCIAIYFFRLFERHWGSQKFAKFYLFTTYASFILQIILTSSLTSRKMLISGPYGFLFAALLVYIVDIPSTANLKLFNMIPITDKQTIYVVFVQLMLSSFPQTLVPALSGVLAGGVYQFILLRVFKLDRKIKFPKFVLSLADQIKQTIQGGSTNTTNTTSSTNTANATANLLMNNNLIRGGAGGDISEQELNEVFNQLNQQQQQLQTTASNNNTATSSSTTTTTRGGAAASDESVQQLMELGFSRQACETALRQANNDIHLATELLLMD